MFGLGFRCFGVLVVGLRAWVWGLGFWAVDFWVAVFWGWGWGFSGRLRYLFYVLCFMLLGFRGGV